ncbi:helix-turn-helix domain-containing protein [Gracilibacillus saliphilus]|uniref:helix-turn-helix domain-containing protein n=1 Tax=Gracilibacillus saliphilus TaxID=543890 RepID=UPI0013D1FAC4|nr:helix-turn-helix transcriptional regulator [Gracilibacillus saliphilus]
MKGTLLKDVRYVTDLTQKQLGELIGVSQSAIAQMESETIKILPETKEKIINVLTERNLHQEEIYILGQLKKHYKGV